MKWFLTIVFLLTVNTVNAVSLSFTATHSNLVAITTVRDNSLSTLVTMTNGDALIIDLGTTNYVSRFYMTGPRTNINQNIWTNYQANQSTPPKGYVLSWYGNTTNQMTNALGSWSVPYDAGSPIDTEIDYRFSPVLTRYLKFTETNSWNIAEVEVFGSAATPTNAVVCDNTTDFTLNLAALELSYYLGELYGSTVPIIFSAVTNSYTGNIYRVEDLVALAPNYATMIANENNGTLPTGVRATQSGRTIQFKTWPYSYVLISVWEFLERQGVRWVYPEGNGDYVPSTGINLSLLPMSYSPPTTRIFANFDNGAFLPWPFYVTQSMRQSWLFQWRNHFTSGQTFNPFGGTEVPSPTSSGIPLNPDYSEGFSGYPHNFNNVVPAAQLLAHTDWQGYYAGSRIPPGGTVITFDQDNPDVIDWVTAKMLAYNQTYSNNYYALLPMDATLWCVDPQYCVASNILDAASGSYSGSYYSFVDAVARGVSAVQQGITVGSLAYAEVFPAPIGLTTLHSNVFVEVTVPLASPYNLPLSAYPNNYYKTQWDLWGQKASSLNHYSYALWHSSYWQPNPTIPVPQVETIVDVAKYFARLNDGAVGGGSQGTLNSVPYNPWSFYAYPRIYWNTNQTAGILKSEFFKGYAKEAALSLSNYYDAAESQMLTNEVNMSYRSDGFNIMPGSFPLATLRQMQLNLTNALSTATNWWVKEHLANMLSGFNYVISESGLTGTNLGSNTPYPAVSTGGAFTQLNLSVGQALQADLPWNNFAIFGSGIWTFYSQGSFEMGVNIPRRGNYAVKIGVKADTTPVLIQPFLNGKTINPVQISSTSYVTNTYILTNVPPGVQNFYLYGLTSGGPTYNVNNVEIALATPDVYVSQDGTGTEDGTTAANSVSMNGYNQNTNGLQPGSVIHLVGTITETFYCFTDGVEGNRTTYVFEPGAKLSTGAFGSLLSGAMVLNGQHHMLVDGMNVGVNIENTNNGTSLGIQQQSTGIFAASGNDIVIQNMYITNMYQRTGYVDFNRMGGCIDISDCLDITVQDCHLGMAETILSYTYLSGSHTNVNILRNTMNEGGHHLQIATSESDAYLWDSLVQSNIMSGWSHWDSPINTGSPIHCNGLITYVSDPLGVSWMSNVVFEANFVGPNAPTNNTSAFFFDILFDAEAFNHIYVRNNVFVTEYPWQNGLLNLSGSNCVIANNTFVGSNSVTPYNGRGNAIVGGYGCIILNNLFTSMGSMINGQGYPGVGPNFANFNVYDQFDNTGTGFVTQGTDYGNAPLGVGGWIAFANLQGWETNSVFVFPLRNTAVQNWLPTTDATNGLPMPVTRFTDALHGTNLSSQFTKDFNGVTRSGNWIIGAYQTTNSIDPPVGSAPMITVQPNDISTLTNMTATFTLTAGGDPTLYYQWQFTNGTPVTNFNQSATWTTNSVAALTNYYFCVITNPYGSVTSSIVYWHNTNGTPLVLPSISVQPTDVTTLTNQTATFTLTALGSPTLYYQWRYTNQVPVTNFTAGATWTTNRGTPLTNYFLCVVTNAAGSVTSSVVFWHNTNGFPVVPFVLGPGYQGKFR